ncbi:MAG: hypothetical protein M1825_002735 [Sarcosagium campestre]|nr:MAG: hypothetical protein M1825_002735 [Sarcosagium campestre]
MWISFYLSLFAYLVFSSSAAASTDYLGNLQALVKLPCGTTLSFTRPSSFTIQRGSISFGAEHPDLELSLQTNKDTKFEEQQNGFAFNSTLSSPASDKNRLWLSTVKAPSDADVCNVGTLWQDFDSQPLVGSVSSTNVVFQLSSIATGTQPGLAVSIQLSFSGSWDSSSAVLAANLPPETPQKVKPKDVKPSSSKVKTSPSHSSPLASTTTNSASITSSSTATTSDTPSTTTPTSSSTSSASPTDPNSPSTPTDMNPGAIAGIVIGAVVVTSLIVALALALFLTRRRRHRRGGEANSPTVFPELAYLYDPRPGPKSRSGSLAAVNNATTTTLGQSPTPDSDSQPLRTAAAPFGGDHRLARSFTPPPSVRFAASRPSTPPSRPLPALPLQALLPPNLSSAVPKPLRQVKRATYSGPARPSARDPNFF